MTIVADIIDRIYAARRQQEAAVDELERLEGISDMSAASSSARPISPAAASP